MNRRSTIVAGFVLTVCLLHPIGAAAPPQAGDQAPPLGLEKLLQSPEGAKADWESLRGKVVVLDFWATWCGPCVASIPALNKLEENYKGKGVQFISITDEPESKIRAFLKKKPIHGWIGLDSDNSAFKAYGVSSRPTIVIVDKHGKLVGKTSAYELTLDTDILDDLLAGKTRKLESTRIGSDLLRDLGQGVEDLAGKETDRPLCLITIRRSQPMRETLGGTSREFLMRAAPLRRVIARAYKVPEVRVTGAAIPSDDEMYDVIFIWSKGSLAAGEAILRETIQATFGLRIRQEKQMIGVYVLDVRDGMKPSLEPSMSGMVFDPVTRKAAPTREILARMNAGEVFFGALGDTQDFAENLSYCLDRPVVDEANIEGYYQFYFPYDFHKPDRASLIKAVGAKYGLKLTVEKREVEVLVVEDASTASTSRH